MRSTIILGALSALSFVAADFPLDPNVVDPTTRNQWCASQFNACDQLCGGPGSAPTNDCDPETLKYKCTCADGKAPALDEYINTMPTHICEKAFEVCNAANVGDARAQKNCTTTIQDNCGTKDPFKENVNTGGGSSEESSAPTTAGAAETTPPPTSTPTTTPSNAAANLAMIGNSVAVVAAGVLAALLL
ncbi:hypothetical protein V8F20_001631 [Naviculisporaceae sp. PSN 640]